MSDFQCVHLFAIPILENVSRVVEPVLGKSVPAFESLFDGESRLFFEKFKLVYYAVYSKEIGGPLYRGYYAPPVVFEF